MESIERRAAWISITVGIVLVFDASIGGAYGFGGISTWELVVYIGGLVCLAAAGVLVVIALAPPWVRPFTIDERERLAFFALALLALALVAIVVLAAHASIEAHRHPQG